MKTIKRILLILCAMFMASQPVLAQNDEDTRNKAVITTDDGDRQLITDEISVIRFDGPKVTVVQPWGDTVFDRTLRSLTFLRPLPGTLRLTVNLNTDEDAGSTRGHSIDGNGYLASTWSENDRVYVYADAATTTSLGTLKPATTGGQVSKMTGDITATNLTNGQKLYLSTLPRTHIFASQTGDVEDAAMFYLTAESTVTINGGNATTANATFQMAQAVLKVTLKDGSNNDVSVKSLVITGSTETITVTPTSATNILYVALPAKASTNYSFTATDNNNREWTGSKTAALDNGKYYRTTVTMTKTMLNPSVTAPTAVASALTYSGSDQKLFNNGLTSGGVLKYKVTTLNTKPTSTNGFKTTIDQGTNVGTYYLWYYVEGDEDYYGTGISSTAISKTISAASSNVTTAPVGNAGLTYTGSAQVLVNATSAACTGGTLVYCKTINGAYGAANTITETAAGTYSFYYKVQGDGNHSDTDPVQVTGVEIAKATYTVSGTASATASYGTQVKDIVISGLTVKDISNNTVAGTWAFASTEVPSVGNSTVYSATFTPSAADANYNALTQEITPTITAVAATVTTPPTAASLTYNGSAQLLFVTTSAAATNGTLQYSKLQNSGYTDDPTTITETDAGTYTVWYKAVASDANHSDSETQSIEVTIAKYDITNAIAATAIADQQYAGAQVTPAAPAIKMGETTIDASNYDVTYGSNNAVGTGTVTYTAKSGSTNFTGTLTVNFTITSGTLAVTANDYNAAYDGSAHGITVTCAGATIKYSESEGSYTQDASPTLTDVGTKTVYYQVTKDNYTTVTGSKTITISQKALTITVKAQAITYGGTISSTASDVTTDGLVDGDALTSITLAKTATDYNESAYGSNITATGAVVKRGENDVTANYGITYNAGDLTINKAAATLTCSTDALSFTALQGANSTVTKTSVSCTGGTISVSSGTEANCTVSYSEGTITVRRVNTAAFTDTEITVSVTPDANHTAPSSVTFSVSAVAALPAGELPGKFTINAGGGQVSFSQGNLQYQASTSTWRFAPNQYDMIGSDNANISNSYTGWIDLFGWGTGNNPTNSSTNSGDYSIFTDWGVNAISNGGNTANMWSTLTKDEWVYLFANHTKGWSNVNDVYGYVIRPDGVSTAVAASYTSSEWAVEEAAGSVFLPAACSRGGTTFNPGAWGDYWTSTPYNSNDAYYLYFHQGGQNPSSNSGRFGGRSVRLVYETPFFQGAGTEQDPFLISSAADWNYLAIKVNSGTNYAGKFFRQTANINVTTMVGNSSDSKPFSGTYDGDGKTLNLSLNTSTPHTAPFRLIANATIKNVVTTGTVHSTVNHPSGLVGTTDGTCTIQNCRVGANVGGAQHSGGIVGHSMHANIYIIGCVYSGTLSPASGQLTGGIIGWGGDGGGHTISISDCLFAGTLTGSTTFHPVGIVQNTNNTRTVSNTYYTVAHNMSNENTHGNSFVNGLSYKGKFARSISAGTDVTVARTGATAVYDVSGITSYDTGILYNGVLYAGNGEAVSLLLSHGAAPSGYTFGQYTVNGGGTLNNPTSNSPTLTMADANQTINADWIPQGAMTFNYTGAVQTFTALATGYYTLECYGAQGGTFTSNRGGYGGTSHLTYQLTQGDVLYIYVGGQGGSIAESKGLPDGGNGGWNGGGKGGTGVKHRNVESETPWSGGGGGGGATHIATNAIGPITKSTDFTSNHTNLLLIAGGGGGGCSKGEGGNAGGATGEKGFHLDNFYIWSIDWNNGTCSCGKDGMLSSWEDHSCEGCGGGGGGYVGGNTWVVQYNEPHQCYSGAGGSSWGETTNGKGYTTTTGGATEGGNGKAVITWYGTTYP